MAKKLSKSAENTEEAPALSSAEDIMSPESWDARLVRARKKREQALASTAPKSGLKPVNNSNQTKADQNQLADEPDSDVPSIDEILTTSNWNDQFAKATARRKQIMAKRSGDKQAASPQPDPNQSRPFKNVVRGAFTGISPHEQVEQPKATATAAPIGQANTVHKKVPQRRYGRLTVVIALLIGFVALLATPVIDMFGSNPGEFATKMSMPDISQSLPTVGGVAENSAATNLRLPSLATKGGARPVEISAPLTAPDDFVAPTLSVVSPSIAPETNPTMVLAPTVEQSAPIMLVSTFSDNPISKSTPSAAFGRLPEFRTNSDLVLLQFHASNSYTDVTTSLPLQSELLTSIALPDFSRKITEITAPQRLAALDPTEFLESVLTKRLTEQLSTIAQPQASTVNLIGPQTNVPLELKLPILRNSRPNPAIGAQLPTVQTQDRVYTSLASPQPLQEKSGVSNGQAAAVHISLNAPESLADEKLNSLAAALRETGFNVGDANRVGFNISKNNVRFFFAQDAQAAKLLADAIGGIARDFTDFTPRPPSGTVEIWLAGKPIKRTSRRNTRSAPREDPALTALRAKLLKSLRQGDFR